VSNVPRIISHLFKCDVVHSCDVVHGDLSGVRTLRSIHSRAYHYYFKSNVLLDSDGKAFLADFGLSNIVVELMAPRMSRRLLVDQSAGLRRSISVSQRAVVSQP
jgi:serine/threonine protein kinase